jgi:hypothetical protein
MTSERGAATVRLRALVLFAFTLTSAWAIESLASDANAKYGIVKQRKWTSKVVFFEMQSKWTLLLQGEL